MRARVGAGEEECVRTVGPDNFGYAVLLVGMLLAAAAPIILMWLERHR